MKKDLYNIGQLYMESVVGDVQTPATYTIYVTGSQGETGRVEAGETVDSAQLESQGFTQDDLFSPGVYLTQGNDMWAIASDADKCAFIQALQASGEQVNTSPDSSFESILQQLTDGV